MLNTVVIGFGAAADTLGADRKMAQWFGPATHAQVLCEHAAFDWCAVIDPSVEAQDRARQKWQIRDVYPAVSEMKDREKVECAILATPPHARIEAIEAFPNLRAVIVEKPLGQTSADGQRFMDLCEQRGVLTQVAYWRRAVEGYQALANGGIAQLIGRPQAVFGLYGNGLLNNGSHLIDFMRLLLGDVKKTTVFGCSSAPGGSPVKYDLNLSFGLEFENGVGANVQAIDFAHYREVGVDIWGDRGRLSIFQEGLGAFHYPIKDNRGLEGEMEVDSSAPEVLDLPVHGCFAALYDNLADSLQGKADLFSSGRSALETDQIVHSLAMSAEAGAVN